MLSEKELITLLDEYGDAEAYRVICYKNEWIEKARVCEARKQLARDKLIAALLPEPNQPKGSGNYWLITKASVTNGPLHPIVRIGNLSHLLVSDITGHWEPIYTPDKE